MPAEGSGIHAVRAASGKLRFVADKGIDTVRDIPRIHVRTHEAFCQIVDVNSAVRNYCLRYMVAVILVYD